MNGRPSLLAVGAPVLLLTLVWAGCGTDRGLVAPEANKVLAANMAEAATTLRVSDFGGSLQAAVNAAADGYTIVVDVPSSGAFVDKRLVIRGEPGGFIETTGQGLRLLAGATGSVVHHLHFQAPIGATGAIAINGPGGSAFPAADDVEVHHCTIDRFRSGIRGRFADRWNVHDNVIVIDGSVFNNFNINVAGIVLNAGVDAWNIHHNAIIGEQKGVYLFNAAPDLTPIADVVIKHNQIVASAPMGAGVFLHSRGSGGRQVNIDIKANDLSRAERPVLVFAAAVIEDERSEPGAFELNTSAGAFGVIDGLIVRANEF